MFKIICRIVLMLCWIVQNVMGKCSQRAARYRSWLRHCATSRKVAGSIPYCVIGIFHWHYLNGRTNALGSTQPLTEMGTRNTSWKERGGGVKAAGAEGWQPYHLYVPIVLKSAILNLLEPVKSIQACNWITLPLRAVLMAVVTGWWASSIHFFLSPNGLSRRAGKLICDGKELSCCELRTWFITPAVNSNMVYTQGVMYTVRYSALQPLVGGEVYCGGFKKCLVYELLMWPITRDYIQFGTQVCGRRNWGNCRGSVVPAVSGTVVYSASLKLDNVAT